MAEHSPARAGEPLPLIERPPSPPPASPGNQPGPHEQPDHEPATWYRLVTALTSCYVYLVAHTSLDPCRFELDTDGMGTCYLGAERQWQISLPPAAYQQFEFVVALWRSGRFNESTQAEAVLLGEPRRLSGGSYGVDVLPAETKRTRTTVHR
jgi:hypothetical protein